MDVSTYPTFQGVWPNLYATDKFYVHAIADAYLFILLHMFFRGQTSGTLLSNKQQTLLFKNPQKQTLSPVGELIHLQR